ncbi:MAG: type II toxin-antitoxin system RelE/ParE family toxin [Acidobacteria bacterium]|nr:type II toxin-antitoxin system RelE/ParE family toxin [Acidobacteriota bacterium]
MKRQIVLRPAAGCDLDREADYIAQHQDLDTALRFYQAAEETFRLIATQPQMGRRRDFGNPQLKGVRVCLMKEFDRHLVFYRPRKGGIEVLRIIHGARDIENLLR